MKVIKESKNLGTQEFICKECGTEFSAERGEYTQTIGEEKEDLGWKKGWLGIETDTALYKATPSFVIDVVCPSCGSEITNFIPTGEKSYTEEIYCGG
jgi:rubredoxin